MDELDKMLAEAREAPAPPGLMGRVLEDALAQQPQRAPLLVPDRPWARLLAMLGGWQGVGGLAAATCAGVWIGLSPPQYLPVSALDMLGAAEPEQAETTAFGWSGLTFEDAS